MIFMNLTLKNAKTRPYDLAVANTCPQSSDEK
jgi:hypothetical protein